MLGVAMFILDYVSCEISNHWAQEIPFSRRILDVHIYIRTSRALLYKDKQV